MLHFYCAEAGCSPCHNLVLQHSSSFTSCALVSSGCAAAAAAVEHLLLCHRQLNVEGTRMACNATTEQPLPCPLPPWLLQQSNTFYYDHSGLECPVIAFSTQRDKADKLARVYRGAPEPEVRGCTPRCSTVALAAVASGCRICKALLLASCSVADDAMQSLTCNHSLVACCLYTPHLGNATGIPSTRDTHLY